MQVALPEGRIFVEFGTFSIKPSETLLPKEATTFTAVTNVKSVSPLADRVQPGDVVSLPSSEHSLLTRLEASRRILLRYVALGSADAMCSVRAVGTVWRCARARARTRSCAYTDARECDQNGVEVRSRWACADCLGKQRTVHIYRVCMRAHDPGSECACVRGNVRVGRNRHLEANTSTNAAQLAEWMREHIESPNRSLILRRADPSASGACQTQCSTQSCFTPLTRVRTRTHALVSAFTRARTHSALCAYMPWLVRVQSACPLC